eukprot:7163294-Heterocapsa_arctica.AAC.1
MSLRLISSHQRLDLPFRLDRTCGRWTLIVKRRVPALDVHTHVGILTNASEPLRAQNKPTFGTVATHVGKTRPGDPVQEPG